MKRNGIKNVYLYYGIWRYEKKGKLKIAREEYMDKVKEAKAKKEEEIVALSLASKLKLQNAKKKK